MAFRTIAWRAQSPTRVVWRPFCFFLLLPFASLLAPSTQADGCFVFKWNKAIDINEPTQKAIIVHDAGREDLLLQVKYEGPLEEFGWLIPVPSLPVVEMGSMDPFYELSEMTQFQVYQQDAFLGRGGHEEAVRVIELKTVGAYEVAVLSPRDAGSLARWLEAHDYSLPDGKSEAVDDYIRRGWYFIAAKIQLNEGVAFKAISATGPRDVEVSTNVRKMVQKKLSSGELHPLLISFDTPKCVFPLGISAVGGKPSEVSLYVLSAEPLLNRSFFDEAQEKLHQSRLEWDCEQEQRRSMRQHGGGTLQRGHTSLELSAMINSLVPGGRLNRDWTAEDLAAMGKEGLPRMSRESLDDDSYFPPHHFTSHKLLQCLRVFPKTMPQSAKAMPRLAAEGKEWFLTKHARTFRPEEMHDLEFERAIPAVAQLLLRPEGSVAAGLLPQLGPGAGPVLVAASKSANPIERANAAYGLGTRRDTRFVEPLLNLLKDDSPRARLNAARAAGLNWDPRFAEPLKSLFRDEHLEIRKEATRWLCRNDDKSQSAVYLGLLRDPDPDVQSCALQVISRINEEAIPRVELLRLLAAPRIETVFLALHLLQEGQILIWPYQPQIQDRFSMTHPQKGGLLSAEAAPLTANQITLARLAGLRILALNSDAEAVELTLPLLRDSNAVIRSRAFVVLQDISGQDIPTNDPARWEAWWAANKTTFSPRKSAP